MTVNFEPITHAQGEVYGDLAIITSHLFASACSVTSVRFDYHDANGWLVNVKQIQPNHPSDIPV